MTEMLWAHSAKTEQWQLLFPTNPTRSYQQSATFVKRLTVAALSTISFHRGMFPCECFEEYKLCNTRIVLLKKNNNFPLAHFVKNSIDSAMDAIDKQYLRTLEMAIHDEHDSSARGRIEAYCLDFQYGGTGVQVTLKGTPGRQKATTLQQIQESIQDMLQAAVNTARVEPALPAAYEVVFRLYYTEDTPMDYQPANYVDGGSGERAPRVLQLVGSVFTGHHTVHLNRFGAMHREAELRGLASRAGSATPSSRAQYPVRCACELDLLEGDDITMPYILCIYCQTLQHAPCYGVTADNIDLVRDSHCCVPCARADSDLVCTDRVLMKKHPAKARSLCVVRCALEWCSQVPAVSASCFARGFSLQDGEALKLMSMLTDKHVVRPLPGGADPMETERTVDNEVAQVKMLKYFGTTAAGNDTAHSAENASSAEPQIQNISSQENTDSEPLIMLVEKSTKPKKIWEKKSEFLAALPDTEVMDGELPLSGSHNPVQDKPADVSVKATKCLSNKRKRKSQDEEGLPKTSRKSKKHRV